MTITERLMKPGRFEVRLRKDTPNNIRDAVAKFDHLVITPNRLPSTTAFTDARVLAAAIYTGCITARPNANTYEGAGLEMWLGTEDGRGDLLDTAVSNTSATLSTWTTSLLPSSLTAGTVTNTGTNLTQTFQWLTRREALDFVCRSVGAERRVNPNFTVDAAAPGTLFSAYTTPTAVITRNPEGTDAAYTAIDASLLTVATDVDGYTTKVIVVGQAGDGAQVATGSSTGSNVYKDGLNNNVVMERLVNAPTTPAANANAYAASILALYSSERRSITLSSKTYALPLKVRVGDRVWAYDPIEGIVDLTTQIRHRGRLINPLALRVKAITWPIESGMGVFVRRSGATPTYTDLTDYIEWENGTETWWEVGTSLSGPDQDPSQLGAAYLGVNPDIAARVANSAWIDHSPSVAFTNFTLGNGTINRCKYVLLDNHTFIYEVKVTLGSTSTVSGTIGVSTPFTMQAANEMRSLCYLVEGGVGAKFGTISLGSTTRIDIGYPSVTGTLLGPNNTSATTPFVWGNTDTYAFQFVGEIA